MTLLEIMQTGKEPAAYLSEIAQFVYLECNFQSLMVSGYNSLVDKKFKADLGVLLQSGLEPIKRAACSYDYKLTKLFIEQLKAAVEKRYSEYLNEEQNLSIKDGQIFSLGHVKKEGKWCMLG